VAGQQCVGRRLLTGKVGERGLGQCLVRGGSVEGGIARPVQPAIAFAL
jgi:hypothetical protein